MKKRSPLESGDKACRFLDEGREMDWRDYTIIEDHEIKNKLIC